METPMSTAGTKEFQVAGVSRSGRVRKKSSKLLDFESPEEFERKPKRQPRQPARFNVRGRPSNAMREQRNFDDSAAGLIVDFSSGKTAPATAAASAGANASGGLRFGNGATSTPQRLAMTSSAVGLNISIGSSNATAAAADSEDEIDNLVADLVEGVEAECSTNAESKVRQSLYMREKATKRKVLKDGTVVTGKTQRKDKGKSRYTAYSLWAREIRKRDFPDLDFASAARRLSELWSNVSNKEKNAWRRKAKVQATKAKTREKNDTSNNNISNTPYTSASYIGSSSAASAAAHNVGGGSAAAASSGSGGAGAGAINGDTTGNSGASAAFFNRATTNRTRKIAAERQLAANATALTGAMPPTTVQTGDTRTSINSNRRSTIATRNKTTTSSSSASASVSCSIAYGNSYTTGLPASTSTSTSFSPSCVALNARRQSTTASHANNISSVDELTQGKTPPPSISAIDAAAHLKLLGESLTIIGERLKEHDGQIALSGSLSVLLDSLLCSLGPLLCLTTLIPGLENKTELNTNLSKTLDNIAYVMPGL